MCWSGEASTCLAVTGFVSSAYFTLQAYIHAVIEQCFNPNNQIATLVLDQL